MAGLFVTADISNEAASADGGMENGYTRATAQRLCHKGSNRAAQVDQTHDKTRMRGALAEIKSNMFTGCRVHLHLQE